MAGIFLIFKLMNNSISLVLLFAMFSINAQQWSQDNSQTKVAFKIKNFGVNVDGNFREVNIATNFDINSLSSSYIQASIQVNSITTGIQKRDKHILEDSYFDAFNHKEIQLTSKKILPKGKDNFEMTAELTIKGRSKELLIPLEIYQNEDSVRIVSSFQINRRNFGIGRGSLVMGKTVKISVIYIGKRDN